MSKYYYDAIGNCYRRYDPYGYMREEDKRVHQYYAQRDIAIHIQKFSSLPW